MIDLFVVRGDALSPGEDIVNELIGSIPVAIERGRKELDENGQQMQLVTLETVYRDGVRLGQLLLCADVVRGMWRGKIAGISHKVSGVELTTTLHVKRVAL